MAKGRTKNKRARKPDSSPIFVTSPPPPYLVAYFTLPEMRHGWADARSGGQFYHPSEPVTRFTINIINHPATRLEWNRSAGWTGEVDQPDLEYIVPQIEKSFSPLRFRFRLTFH